MSDEPTIAHLQARVFYLTAELRQANVELHQAMIQAAPFKEGQEVEVQFYGDSWVRSLISRVYVESGAVRYEVRPATKGGWHRTHRQVWSFQNLRAAS